MTTYNDIVNYDDPRLRGMDKKYHGWNDVPETYYFLKKLYP